MSETEALHYKKYWLKRKGNPDLNKMQLIIIIVIEMTLYYFLYMCLSLSNEECLKYGQISSHVPLCKFNFC